MALVAACAFAVLVQPAHADTLQTYGLAWSGASLGNSVSVAGSMTLDLTTMPNPASFNVDLYNDITSLSVTVSGSGTGDGTYTKSDLCQCNDTNVYYTYWFTNGSTIDMTGNVLSELQAVSGGFSLFFASPGPLGTAASNALTLTVGGVPVQMTQFTPVATPEPATLLLMLGGLGVLGLAALRKRGLASTL